MDSQSLVTRIRSLILSRIQDGSWPSGYKIPSEAEIMAQFSASRMTVHRAIKELAAEGHLYRQRGRGTFVARKVPRSQLLVITDIADEISGRGGSYFCELQAPGPRAPDAADQSISSVRRGPEISPAPPSSILKTACRCSSRTAGSICRWPRAICRLIFPRPLPIVT